MLAADDATLNTDDEIIFKMFILSSKKSELKKIDFAHSIF